MHDSRLIQAAADKLLAAGDALEDAVRLLDELSACPTRGDLAGAVRDMVEELVDLGLVPCSTATPTLERS